MAFKETTSLLGSGSSSELTEFQQFAILFKKYLLFPLCIIAPLLVLYTLIRLPADGGITSQQASSPKLMKIMPPRSPFPLIPPISELVANGSIRVERFQLTITKGKLPRDYNIQQEVYLVNGKYPGPVIRIQQNSILILTVINRLNISITIHLHGIHQRGTFLSDGSPFVTQDPIPPGGTFTHTVNTWPQAGTFFYHAHTGMDIVWISGPLIIQDDPEVYGTWPSAYHYDEDRIFLINGLYQRDFDSIVKSLTGPVFRYPRVDSVTMNGKSHGLDPPPPVFPGEENDTVPIQPNLTKLPLDVTAVRTKRRYRFRFINAISDGTFNCKIPGHKFTVIEMDGIYSEPVETDNLVISPGQRYSLIVATDQVEANYFVTCKHLENEGPTGLSLMRYAGAPAQRNSSELEQVNRILNVTLTEEVPSKPAELDWILDRLTPNQALNQTDFYQVPDRVDQEFYLDVEEVRIEQRNFYLINGHLFKQPNTSYHEQLSQAMNITDPPQVFEILQGEVIQIIFQNQRLFSVCFGHPWHLHGHSFHVVGSGPDKYDPVTDGGTIKENVRLRRNMQFRDTVTLNGAQTAPETERPKYCGWTAIRFVANNPGLWLAHCHVTPHMIMGKRFVIWEHTAEDPFFQELYKNQLPTH